jgi:hypothetical protein
MHLDAEIKAFIDLFFAQYPRMLRDQPRLFGAGDNFPGRHLKNERFFIAAKIQKSRRRRLAPKSVTKDHAAALYGRSKS